MLRAMISHIPSLRDLAHGAETTALLLRLKWHTIRDKKSKIVLAVGILVLFSAIFFAAHLGRFVRDIAQSDQDNAAREYALVYLQTVSRGELGALGASLLGLSVLSALIAPFTGSIRTSIISSQEMVAFPLTRWHRFVDSLVSQLFSSVSILQLVSLTALSSLLTLQGGRGISILFTWAVWFALVMLSVASIWAADSLYRSFGAKVRWVVLGVAAALIGLAVLLDPEHGKTLFGLGTQYAGVVQNIGLTYGAMDILRAFAVVLLIVFALAMLAATLSSMALLRPERAPSRVEKPAVMRKHRRLTQTFKTPEIELIRFFLVSIFRSSESRKPMLAALGIGLVLSVATSGATTIINTFTVMVPLVAALAWGANAFGALGGGNVWLASQPRIFDRLPWLFFATQNILTLGLFVAMWLPAIVSLRLSPSQLPSIFLAGLAVSAIVSRSSVQKSMFHPHATRFGVRGETLLPPITTLNYTFRFALWAGQYGVIILSANDVMVQSGLAFLAVFWSSYRMTRLHEKWTTNPEIRKEVFATVAQD